MSSSKPSGHPQGQGPSQETGAPLPAALGPQIDVERLVQQRTAVLTTEIETLRRESAERVRAEEGLRFRCALLEAVDRGSTQGVAVVAAGSHVLTCNDRLTRMLGMDFTGTRSEEFFRVLLDRLASPQALFSAGGSDSGRSANWDRQDIHLKDGRTFEMYVVPMAEQVPGRDGTIFYFTDVTEHRRAEAAAAYLATVVNSSEDAIISVDPAGIVRSWNASAERLFGYSEAEIVGRSCDVLAPPEHPHEVTTLLARVRQGGRVQGYEVVRVRKDGTRVEVAMTVSPVRDAFDAIRGFSKIAHDITGRRRAEAAVRESEQRLRVVTDNVPALIAYVDRDQRYRFNNRAYVEWFGLSAGALTGRHLREVLGEDVYRHRVPYVEAALRGEQVRFVGPTRDLQGRVRDTEMAYVPEFRGGTVVGFFVLVQDVTEQKQAEMALRESEQRFRAMADAAPVLIWVAGPDKGRTYFNKRWLEFTGRSMEQELGTGWVQGLHPEDREASLRQYDAAFERREPFKMEYRLRRADGVYRWMLDHGVPRVAPDGTFSGYIGSCVDITDQKEVERELTMLTKRLRSLTAEVALAEERDRRGLAVTLHDAVGQTLAAAQMQLGALVPSVRDAALAGKLSGIQQLLGQALVESRSLMGQLSPAILYELGLEAAVESLAEATERDAGICVGVETEGEAKPMDEEVRVLLFQAVRELLQNVAVHSGARACDVRLRWQDNHVQLSVCDNGVGIEMDASAPHGAGDGLGLFALAERFRHIGGSIRTESAPGTGTRTTVLAPLHPQAEAPSPNAAQPRTSEPPRR